MDERLVALVINSGEHAGPAVARRLAADGARVVVHQPPSELLTELEEAGPDHISVDGDLTSPSGHVALVDEILTRCGRLDAAWIRTGLTVGVWGQFLESPPKLWDTVKVHNLDMVVWALRAVLPPMLTARRGQVLVSTSATGLQPLPGASMYSATRAGTIALVRAVGLELASTGVTVNAIATNFLDVPSFLAAIDNENPQGRLHQEQSSPMGRLGDPGELAEFAAVLLEGRSRFQTGQCFSFSGGWSP